MDDERLVFGSFRLIPAQRILLDDGKPLRLGSRALDILITLVERAGETIPKEQLIARTWPDTVVDEGALRVHVAALRKALGDGRNGRRYITNNPGRGYAFVVPVTHEPARPVVAPTNRAGAGNDLPASLTRIVGRDEIIAALVTQLSRRRFLTIVGPGGIGKTTVALAVADATRASYKDGVWFVGLASLADADLVPSALGTALGIPPLGANPLPGLAAWLRDKTALIVLDSCEHIVGEAAALAEAVLKAAPGISLMTTSREPLRAEGEALHRLAALELPSDSLGLTPGDALRYSAVQLFVERAMAAADGFGLADADVPAVLEICRRLDGIPLALELAAARVGVFGVQDLAAHLDDRFRLLTSGRRTALPRHQTLAAALDWSYQLLQEEERAVLRRLSVFAGEFPLEAAVAVADPDSSGIVDHVANLVGKSLVAADPRGAAAQYRLLDTTRLYAFEKLKSSGELRQVARSHAEYYCAVFALAEAESETRSQSEWLSIYGRHRDNVRAALDWAFSPEGDPQIGVALTVASGLLWTRLSLSDECRRLTKRALSVLGPGSDLATRRQIQLLALLGWSLQQTSGATPETYAAFSKILELSERIHDIKSKSLAMWGLWIYHFNNGEFATALDLAQKSIAEEGIDTIHSLAGERIIGLSLHYLGEQSSSRRQIESVLGRPVDPLHQPHDLSFAIDHRVTLRAFLARILWLQGFPDQAMRMAKENVEEALALNHALSLANALVQAACPIAFFTGDLVAGEHFVRMLHCHSTKHALGPWQAWGRCFEAMLLIKRGDIATGLQGLSTAVSGLRDVGHAVYYLAFMGELAEALGRAGQTARGLATIEEALARSERSKERWCVAELLRIKGELIVSEDTAGAAAAAEDCFLQALDWARRQQTLSWALRIATSLASLWGAQHRVAEARELLNSIYDRFTEGFGTPDLVRAKALLERLA